MRRPGAVGVCPDLALSASLRHFHQAVEPMRLPGGAGARRHRLVVMRLLSTSAMAVPAGYPSSMLATSTTSSMFGTVKRAR